MRPDGGVDVTNDFLKSPILFLHETPCSAKAEFNGIKLSNIQVIHYEGIGARLIESQEATAVPFYMLGWRQEEASVGNLGSQASFFFTGPLSGCTFAVDKNWYTPRVIHVNQTSGTGGMDAQGMMNTIGNRMADCVSKVKFWETGPNITVIQSHDRAKDHVYNIFGYLTGAGWSFFQQVVEMTGEGEKVRQINELNTWF